MDRFAAALAALEILANEGRLEAARDGLEALTAERVDQVGGHGPAGELALTLGLGRLATRELGLAVRDARGTPEEARWLAALVHLQRDLGHGTAEARTRGRMAKIGAEPPLPAQPEPELAPSRPAPPVPVHEPKAATLPPPTTSDLGRFLHLFQGREDVHARQWLSSDGRIGYAPVQRPLTREALQRHLAGSETLGVYGTRADLTSCFFVLDIDLSRPALDVARSSTEGARRLRRLLHDESLRMIAVARTLGLELLPEDSGYKGRHLWGFLAEPMPLGLLRNFVRALGRALAPASSDLAIECFPKQGKLEPGQIGNLIKLPLGIHLRTGRRAWILDADGRPAADPWTLLRQARRHGRDEILDAMARLKTASAPAPEPPSPNEAPAAPLKPDAGFVEADLRFDPELRVLFAGCAVMRVLVERGLERRRLAHEEQMVLRHVLGHRPMGLMAVNYVFRRCPEVGAESYLQSVLTGHPMSCPKIRKRVPDVTAKVPCNCEFKVRTDHYPTPLLHLDEARARGELPTRGAHDERVEPRVAEDWARKVAHVREHLQRLQGELVHAERRLKDELGHLDGQRLALPEGEWRVDARGELVWVPARS